LDDKMKMQWTGGYAGRVTRALATVACALAAGGAASPALADEAGYGDAASLVAGQATLPPLDPQALEDAIGGLPDADTTAALVSVSGSAGAWYGASGVANLCTSAPVPDDARFRIGSITKVFTATVVLQLVAEQLVDLDQSIQHYLPGLLPADFPPITVRQLLNHTSGLPDHDDAPDDPAWRLAHRFDLWTPAQLVEMQTSDPMKFAPGTMQEYGGLAYILAGMLIEEVTGHSYAWEVETRILWPLGLWDTSLPGAKATIFGPHTHGYWALTKKGKTKLVDVTIWNQTQSWAEGEMISTAADLDAFATALFGGDLLPPAQLEEMFTVPDVPYVDFSNCVLGDTPGRACYSAGLMATTVSGLTVWGKTGHRPGYTSGLFATRDLERTVVYSVNDTAVASQGPPAIVLRIAAATLGLGPPGP
jgi:D-alanyl-D-alanine carboxypeptidase